MINDVGFIKLCVSALRVRLPDVAAAAYLPERGDENGDENGGIVAVLLTSPGSDAIGAGIRSDRRPRSASIQRIDPTPIREAIREAMTFPYGDPADSDADGELPAALHYHSHLFDASGSPGGFLAIKSIACVRAAGQGTQVYTTRGGWVRSASSLKDWEARLPETHFTRIHRSTIINIDHVERIERQVKCSGHRVFLHGMQEPLILSRRYAARLRRRRV